MDITEKIRLIEAEPTEEVITREDLQALLETNSSPKHYIGLEISGFLHLGSLLSTGFKIRDFINAGINCTVFLADWHTIINDKMGSSNEKIKIVSKYYADAFNLVCPGVNIVYGSDLYDDNPQYWREFVKLTKRMTLARTMRTLTIMGRNEEQEKVDLAKLLYPPMQAMDIHTLDLDIMHAGMDQRKIHVLVRELFPKMGWKVPIAIHHKLLPGLTEPVADGKVGKMSKSSIASSISVHDTDEEITSKIKKAWCPEGQVENNPLLALAKLMFREFPEMNLERPEKFGGNVTFSQYQTMEDDFKEKRLHPVDLKQLVTQYMTKMVKPIREKLTLSDKVYQAIHEND